MMPDPQSAATGPLSIRFEKVSKSYGSTQVLFDFDLIIEPGEFVTLLGPSGSGKTTVLNLLAGFTDTSEGTIRIGDRDVTDLPSEARNLGMVFQSFALFPHLSVLDNVAFPLRMRGVGRSARRKQARETLGLVQLAEFANRAPHELSGGQKQRVAIARALVFSPPVLLMDECLSSLDLKLREQLQLEIRRLHRELGTTILFVTHDQNEAMALSDRVAVLREGRLVQVGSPRDIYARPASRFIASFIGKANIFDLKNGQLPGMNGGSWPDNVGAISVRTDVIRRLGQSESEDVTFSATIVDTIFQGTALEHIVRLPDGNEILVHEPAEGAIPPTPGEAQRFGFAAARATLLVADT